MKITHIQKIIIFAPDSGWCAVSAATVGVCTPLRRPFEPAGGPWRRIDNSPEGQSGRTIRASSMVDICRSSAIGSAQMVRIQPVQIEDKECGGSVWESNPPPPARAEGHWI